MKYGTFIFTDVAEKRRVDRPDIQNLPHQCCAKCVAWSRFNDTPCMGHCFEHSALNRDGDSEFSWADDMCEEFEERATQLNWEPFPCLVTKLIVGNQYLLRRNSGDICLGEYYTEFDEEFFIVADKYFEKYDFDRIAEIYGPHD